MAMFLLVAHTKGGVSKTTTAVNLVVMLAVKHGADDVLLVDIDSGQSGRAWSDVRSKRGLLPAITCVTLFGSDVHLQIKRLAAKYKYIVIDAGGEGRGAAEIRSCLGIPGIKVLTPCRPPTPDSKRLTAMREMIAEARDLNPTLDAMLFPTQASTNSNSSDVIKFYSDVAEYTEFRVLETVMRYRVSYQTWLDSGEAVIEAKGKKRDPAAIEEFEQLYAEVFA